MNTLMVGQMENATQASIVTLFQQRLGYRCLGRWGALIDALQRALVAEEGPAQCWKALGIEVRAA